MPTYAYRCTDTECGNAFDVVQGFHDAPITECPVCGHQVRKVFSPVGVVFKGSGFYRTDSRGSGSSSEKSGGSSSSSSTSDKSGSDSGASPTKSESTTSSSSSSSSSGSSSSGSSSSSSSAAAS